jgi:mRNA-degrading endonuclease RelE of RelBE toxin-antitoxin system
MPEKILKFIRSLDKKTRERLKNRLEKLKHDPFGEGVDIKKLKGRGANVYRLRFGKIRIVYEIVEKEVVIVDIDYRGNIY